jgi:hypothetical protein
MTTHQQELNRDTFVSRTFWTAWPQNHMPCDDFKTKREAREYVARNGGGGIRKFTRSRTGNGRWTSMDTLEIPAS